MDLVEDEKTEIFFFMLMFYLTNYFKKTMKLFIFIEGVLGVQTEDFTL